MCEIIQIHCVFIINNGGIYFISIYTYLQLELAHLFKLSNICSCR